MYHACMYVPKTHFVFLFLFKRRACLFGVFLLFFFVFFNTTRVQAKLRKKWWEEIRTGGRVFSQSAKVNNCLRSRSSRISAHMKFVGADRLQSYLLFASFGDTRLVYADQQLQNALSLRIQYGYELRSAAMICVP